MAAADLGDEAAAMASNAFAASRYKENSRPRKFKRTEFASCVNSTPRTSKPTLLKLVASMLDKFAPKCVAEGVGK